MAKQAADRKTKELTIHEAWPELDGCRNMLKDIAAQLEMMQAEYDGMKREKMELETQGIKHAGVHYREGKYLYLVYPSKRGEPRQREYIGADTDKIREALESIERGKRWTKLSYDLERIEVKARTTYRSLENTMSVATRPNVW